jgi:hypothetical protein
MANTCKKKPIYNWIEIETDYVTDSTQTYKTLCRKYGPSSKTICHHAQKGNWREKRQALAEQRKIKLQQEMAQAKLKETAAEITKMNEDHYRSQQALKYLADKQVIAEVDKVKSGKAGSLSIKDIQSMANANKTIQESQRLAKGLDNRELNINLVNQHLTPLIEKIVGIIQNHADKQTLEAIIRELTTLFG